MPKMSSRRQFHRALRRHPAWPMVMAEAAARAKAHKEQEAARDRLIKEQAAAQKQFRRAANRAKFQRLTRRDRTNATAMGQASDRSKLHRIIHRDLGQILMGRFSRRAGVRRALRRNRALVVTLVMLGIVVALYGVSLANGFWLGNPAVSPPLGERFGAASAFDEANDELLIFGGHGTVTGDTSAAGKTVQSQLESALGQKANYGDTWAHKRVEIARKWIDRNPVHAPSPRGFASMAYDGARKNVVLFGGAPWRSEDDAISGQTWIWDGIDWTLVEPPEPRPEPRYQASMAYDAHRKVVVMFGGRRSQNLDANSYLNDTWTWDGSRWTIMSSAGAPTPRHSAAMTYNTCRGKAVLFGGVGAAPPNASDFDEAPSQTWTWNGTKWEQAGDLTLRPTGGRIGASMTYSHDSGRVLLFGGYSTDETGRPLGAVDSDVWAWDGLDTNGWTKMNSDAKTPPFALTNGTVWWNTTEQGIGTSPVPRAYASFTSGGRNWPYLFDVYGGTPSVDSGMYIVQAKGSAKMVALGDEYRFAEPENSNAAGDDGDTNIVDVVEAGNAIIGPAAGSGAGCTDPIPIPTDEVPPTEGKDAREDETGISGTREVGKFPVLRGAPWPLDQRSPRIGSGSNPPPNPKYTPAPECPRREFIGGASTAIEAVRNTHLATDPARNRIYQFYFCDPVRPGQTPSEAYRLLAQAYDGKTLKPVGPAAVLAIAQNVTFARPPRHDPERGRFLFSGGNDLYILDQTLLEKSANSLTKIDMTAAGGLGVNWSFFNHPATGRAKLLVNKDTSIAQVDLDDKRQDWTESTTGCLTMNVGVGTFESSPAPMRSGDRVYSACQVSGNAGNGRHGVVAIPIEEVPGDSIANDKEEGGAAQVFPGPFNGRLSWNDSQGERVLILTGAHDISASLWVFDGKTSRYAGRAGIAANHQGGRGYGFDPGTGRFYVLMPDDVNTNPSTYRQIQGGLLMIDARLTPVSQPLNFTQFMRSGEAQIATLPAGGGLPRRIFVRRGSGFTPSEPASTEQVEATQDAVKTYPDGATLNFPDEMHYLVLADEMPIPKPVSLAERDLLTIPVAESAGKTQASFEAEGGGYGFRLRSVGGVWSALRPPYQVFEGLWDNNVDKSILTTFGRPYIPTCLTTDREMMAGWVPGARLSDLDAGARSTGLEVDQSSKVDVTGPFSRCNPPLGPSDLPPTGAPVYNELWPLKFSLENEANQLVGPNLSWDKFFKEVECVGDSSANHRATVGDVYGFANCIQKQGLVEATARNSATGAKALSEADEEEASKFGIAEGYSTVTVKRETDRGVVVTTTAIAKGVKLPNITIGLVKTEAVAWSNGRPSDGPRATFTRTICNVDPPLSAPNPSQSNPQAPNTGCLNEAQQKQMVKDWNDKWGVNSKMYLPTPDPELLAGSPGGYIAGVIKPAGDEIEAQLFAKDFQREVPGLVIVFPKDSVNTGPARQSLELAAVRAVAGYGVQCASDRIYSPESKDCVPYVFDDEPTTEGLAQEEEFFEEQDPGTPATEGYWVPVAAPSSPLSIGNRLGRFIENLPVVRLLPIRQIGEALLTASIWALLGLPLTLASRRFAFNLARRK